MDNAITILKVAHRNAVTSRARIILLHAADYLLAPDRYQRVPRIALHHSTKLTVSANSALSATRLHQVFRQPGTRRMKGGF